MAGPPTIAPTPRRPRHHTGPRPSPSMQRSPPLMTAASRPRSIQGHALDRQPSEPAVDRQPHRKPFEKVRLHRTQSQFPTQTPTVSSGSRSPRPSPSRSRSTSSYGTPSKPGRLAFGGGSDVTTCKWHEDASLTGHPGANPAGGLRTRTLPTHRFPNSLDPPNLAESRDSRAFRYHDNRSRPVSPHLRVIATSQLRSDEVRRRVETRGSGSLVMRITPRFRAFP